MLKLDVAFLYDLLGASQEHKIKSKFAQTDIDEVIIGHTNEPEYRRLENNEFYGGAADRTVRIDIPYITRLRDDLNLRARLQSPQGARPHRPAYARGRRDVGRADTPREVSRKPLTLLQKLKLYNGRTLPGFTEDNIKELRKDPARRHGGHLAALHPG